MVTLIEDAKVSYLAEEARCQRIHSVVEIGLLR